MTLRSLLNAAYVALVGGMDADEQAAFDERIGMNTGASKPRASAPRMRHANELKPGESPWRVDPAQQAAAMRAMMTAAAMPAAVGG